MTPGAIMFLLDVVWALLVWPAALGGLLPARFALLNGSASGIEAALLFPAAHLLFLYALGLYRREAILAPAKALARLPVAAALAAFAAVVVGKMLARLVPDWPEPADGTLLFSAAFLCLSGCAVLARLVFRLLRRQRLMRSHLLVVGAGARAWDLVWMLRKEGRNLSYEITCLHDPSFGPLDTRWADDPRVRVVPLTDSILTEARRLQASDIVVAPDERRGMALEALLDCKAEGFVVEQYLSFVEREIRRVDIKRMELSWFLYSDGFQANALDRVAKRVLDIAVSLLILTLASPFLLLAIAALLFDDGWPILYRQTRVTAGQQPFQIFKLRTMRRNAEAGGAVWAAAGDSRITPVGRFLRRSRLDELPQLFNVLRGEMALVGPRPERPEFVCELAAQIPLYNQRHRVKAGLTGWAQVNYPYGASVDDARSKLSYDLYYVKNYSIWFDLRVLVQTLRVVLWPSGVR